MASPVAHSFSGASPPSLPPSAHSTRSQSLVQGITSRSPISEGSGVPSAGDEPEVDMDWGSPVELSADDNGSDFEETLKKKPRRSRRPLLKQAQVTNRVRRDDGAKEDLFEAIRLGKSAMQILVDDWLDGYKMDREAALLGLINFIIQACGCKGTVTRDMMETMENAEIIRKMTEDFDEERFLYHLDVVRALWIYLSLASSFRHLDSLFVFLDGPWQGLAESKATFAPWILFSMESATEASNTDVNKPLTLCRPTYCLFVLLQLSYSSSAKNTPQKWFTETENLGRALENRYDVRFRVVAAILMVLCPQMNSAREILQDSADYPLSLSTKPWKKFRVNFGEFLGKLVSCCQYSMIYDGILMDTLISLLTGLSDSQVRAFRHTSTFAAMKLMTALVKVARAQKHHLDTIQRQFNVERAKSPEKRSAERLETLMEKMTEMHSNLEDIGNMMNGLFKGVFVHRYRDTHPDVRALCIEELGIWITTYPQSFLNDSYLKYLGWMLHDKQGPVRLQCLRSLHELYIVPQWAGKLELFTSRFKNRMVSMALDKEYLVSAEAIQLIGLIYKNMENILSREDCESIYPLVYASNRAVATAAGEFVYQRLLDTSAEEQTPEHSNRRSSHTSFFHLLIDFFISSELHEHAAYLVDSLWDSVSTQLRDWECQTDLLLMKKTCLDDQEESALIKILVSSIRQAAEGTSPVGRALTKKILSAKDKKTHSEDKLRLSRHMIVTLPHLLAKFSADEDKMAALLKVVVYLELEIYSTERLEKNLDLLLIQVHDIMEKHTEPLVLEACSRALYILCDQDLAFCKRTDIMLSQLVDKLTSHFQDHLPDILQVTDLDEDDVYNTAATMKRLSALYSAHDLTRWELFEPCSHILQKAIDTSEVPEQIILPALVCCHFSLLWELAHFNKRQSSEEELATLRKRLLLFLSTCQSLLSDLHCSVREQAFKLLSDLLVIFNDHIGRGDRSHLQMLSYSPDLPLQAELAGFLVDHVFTNSEDEDSGDEGHKIQRLHERRILLAGYCKLILYNTLELRFASEVFKYYVKYSTDYGDIIKETLSRSRRVSKEESTRTILLCLTQAYTGLSLEDDSPDRRFSQPFLEIRELARRFSLLLGPDQIRNRQDVVLLHKEGIKFSLRSCPGDPWSPQNLLFLDVLSEFSPKLLKQDKAALLHYLQETCQQCIPPEEALRINNEDDEIWAPLHAYKKSLGTDMESGPATPGTRRAQERRQTRSPRVSPVSKKRRFGKEDSSSVLADEDDQQSPLMSSTLLRRRKTMRSPADDRGGSDSDFDTSQSTNFRRPLKSAQKMRGEALRSSLYRLNLMEGDEEEEMVIDDRESSATSTAGEEEELDLLDSAILDSED